VKRASTVLFSGVCRRRLSSSVTLHGKPAGGFTRAGQAMTRCRLQSNYSSTVRLHGGPVVLHLWDRPAHLHTFHRNRPPSTACYTAVDGRNARVLESRRVLRPQWERYLSFFADFTIDRVIAYSALYVSYSCRASLHSIRHRDRFSRLQGSRMCIYYSYCCDVAWQLK